MANRDGAAHIAAAVRSVLRQTERSLELIISDAGSSDHSAAVARAAAGDDPRLVLLQSEERLSPGGARNRAIAVARGRWIAIVDSDDFIHPERLERLIAAAEADGADIAADDLLTFYQTEDRAPHAHLRGAFARAPRWVSPAAYERSNRMLGRGPALGYLKPVFRRALGAVYDESLRIGEDSDIILRLLIAGARMRIYPTLGYFYRRHDRSVSHRLDAASIDALIAANRRLDPGGDTTLARELGRGRSALEDARAFTDLITALKARDVGGALAAGLKRPLALRHLQAPIAARLFTRRPRQTPSGPPRITVLSRQRIVGSTNGSSAYVLVLASALKHAGYAVDYLGASPKIFGRWALMRLRAEVRVFNQYRVRGGIRLGPLVLAQSPLVWAKSALAVLERGLNRLGMTPSWSRAAEYAQGATATRADMLYVARHAARPAAVLCDYAFLAPLAPYALSPDARSFIVMHDFMSQRIGDEAERNPVDLTAADERRLLSLADVVIAIQQSEASQVRAVLPGARVIVAPHAAAIVHAPQLGIDDTLLFIGSNTAPNIVGLERFFRDVWPVIRAQRPAARLKVAGSVARGLGAPPEGVSLLGVVDDLEPLYRDAGVVISPLHSGSGLKIKLIEALAAGKAVVGTSVTTQGVEAIVASAMAIEDDPRRFADVVSSLAADRSRRAALGAAALACARANFSADACFQALIEEIHGGAQPQTAQPAAPTRAVDRSA